MAIGTTQCAFCKETIHADATVCRHCRAEKVGRKWVHGDVARDGRKGLRLLVRMLLLFLLASVAWSFYNADREAERQVECFRIQLTDC